MIKFYPRDIGLWREIFDFEIAKRPSMMFDNEQDLTSFVSEHFPIEEENKYPVTFIEEKNHHLNTTHIVFRWTVVGWMTKIEDHFGVR